MPDRDTVGGRQRRRCDALPEIASVRPRRERPARAPAWRATLEPDPYSAEALDLVPEMRDVAAQAGGEETLVGGPTADDLRPQRRRRRAT